MGEHSSMLVGCCQCPWMISDWGKHTSHGSPCDGGLSAPLRLLLASDVSQADTTAPLYQESMGEASQSSQAMCTPSSKHGCGRTAPTTSCCFGELWGVPFGGSCLLRNLGLPPHFLPPNAIGSRVKCTTVSRCGKAERRCPGLPAPRSGVESGALSPTMISLTAWSRAKVAPRRPSAETGSSHLYVMAPSHSCFNWLPCLH